MRRFVIVGQRARDGFSLDDLPSTSGRLDLLLRAARAALLVSHGVRRDTVVYLVMQAAGRTLKIDGRTAQFLRPDERSLAIIAQKALARTAPEPVRGVSVIEGGVAEVLRDIGEGPRAYVLDERAALDVREARLERDLVIFAGDHHGIDEAARSLLGSAIALSVGPVSIHADDAVALVVNELDRTFAGSTGA